MNKHLYIYLSVALLFTAPYIGRAQSQERVAGTNTHYDYGDWISYTVLRYVNSIAIGDVYIYFATTGGIGRFDRYREKWEFPWTKSNGLAENDIHAVAYDVKSGYLWCTSKNAVSFMHPTSKRWTNIYYDEQGMSDDERYDSIGFDDRYVWLATSAGELFYSDRYSVNFFSASSKEAGEIIWEGKRAKKPALPPLFTDADLFFDERGYFEDVNLRSFPVTFYIEDAWQNIWIGTWGLGVGRANLYTSRFTLLPYGLLQKDASSIAEKEGEFWMGGFQNDEKLSGVTSWDGGQRWDYLEAAFIIDFYSDNINMIEIGGEDIWFATDRGAVWYNRRNGNWKNFGRQELLPEEWVYDIALDREYIWMATAAGVSRLARRGLSPSIKSSELIEYHALRDLEVYDIEILHNLIWMGTEYGIYIYDAVKDTGGFYAGPDGPFDRAVTAVSRFNDEIWFGTEDGIEAFDIARKEWLRPPARRHGTGRTIHRILAAKEAVWATTDEGVLKFDRARNYWRRFTVKDGLISDEVYAMVLDGNYIWFGSREGITRFYWNSPYRVD